MSTVSSTVDLSTKYQRLAAEYSKLRAQLPVLKNAVVDEQTKNSNLLADLHAKDSAVRRLQAENESFSFRNEQLVRRVEHLQESLDEAAALGSKKKKSKDMPRSQSTMVVSAVQSALEEELQRKVDQNAQLNTKLFEMEETHERELKGLMEKIGLLEAENNAFRVEIESLRERQSSLLVEKDYLAEQLAAAKRQITHSPQHLSPVKRRTDGHDLASELRLATVNGNNDSLAADLGGANHTSVEQNKARGSFKQISKTCQQIFTSLGNYFTYTEQRSTLYPCDMSMEQLSSTTEEYCRALILTSDLLRPVASETQNLLEKCQEALTPDQFSQSLANIQKLIGEFSASTRDTVIPLFEKCLEEECRVSWCNAKLERENLNWRAAFVKFMDAISRLQDAFNLSSDGTENVAKLIALLDDIADRGTEAAERFSAKVALENRMPTATKKLRCTNECLLSCTSSLSKQLVDLRSHVRKSEGLFVLFWRQHAASPLLTASLDHVPDVQDEPFLEPDNPFSPSFDRLVDGDEMTPSTQLLSSTVNGSFCDENEAKYLRAELETVGRRLIELESERERATIESQLLRMKLSANGAEGATNSSSNESELVAEHYAARLNDLMTQLQSAKSRAAYFKNECDQLLKVAKSGNGKCDALTNELTRTKHEVSRLTDDLETTRDGYEEQLSNLSEHLAEMNVKLTSQTETINALKSPPPPDNRSSGRKLFSK
uniref:Protein phosphatase 1 regulatory subunit 21 n=1 Tax=Plectus sambesii TaxID=2011161 RepID=A0A914VCV6_9BILA